MSIAEDGALEIARRSRGTPRLANRLLKRVRDWAQVRGDGDIDEDVAAQALSFFEVDSLGLDNMDNRILELLAVQFGGRPVGLTTLASALSEDTDTLEDVYEPYLMQQGLMVRTPKGRQATERAYEHLESDRSTLSDLLCSIDQQGPLRSLGAPYCWPGARLAAVERRSGKAEHRRRLQCRRSTPFDRNGGRSMLEQDYLMRIILQYAEILRRSWFKAREEGDPKAAAAMLEDAVGEATDIDGTTLLSLSPDSVARVLQVSGTDPRVIEFVVRSLALASVYLRDANEGSLADLRLQQARSLADAYGLYLPENPEDLADLLDDEGLPGESAIVDIEAGCGLDASFASEQPDDPSQEDGDFCR